MGRGGTVLFKHFSAPPDFEVTVPFPPTATCPCTGTQQTAGAPVLWGTPPAAAAAF